MLKKEKNAQWQGACKLSVTTGEPKVGSCQPVLMRWQLISDLQCNQMMRKTL